jgi:HEAT repeat protein
MDHTDITRCIEILNEKPKRFFQKENIANKLQCFHTIQQVGAANMIYFVFSYLRSDNTLLQAKAAETVLFLFVKNKSLSAYSDTLKHVNIKEGDLDFFRLDFDEKTYVQLLGIASLNGNGYVREKAVKELARLKNTEGLKFILLRLGDWVEEVRKAATEAVAAYLDEVYIDALLQQLPVIDWLLKVERVDLSGIHSCIIQFIINQDFTNGFYNKVKRLDNKTRFRLYKSFLASKNLGKEQVYKIVADSNFLVRNELLKQLLRFDPALQMELIKKLLHDPSAVVRLNALYASKSFSPELDQLIALLTSDQVASVRALSRHLLKDKDIDFAKLYRQRIADKQFLSGSLLGLSETGSPDDLATFDQYIFSDNPKLVVPSLVAVNKFSPDTAKHYLLTKAKKFAAKQRKY